MFRRIVHTLLLLTSLSGASQSQADPLMPLKLVSGPEYMPYSDPLLEGGGLATVLVEAAFSAGGLTTDKVVFKPWARGLLETGATAYDATFPYARTAEREAKFYYSDELAHVNESFFAPLTFTGTTVDATALNNKVVCRPVGYNLNMLGEMQKTVPFRIEAPVSLTQCFAMLELGRVDFVFISEQVGWYVLKTSKELDRKQFRAIPATREDNRTGLHLLVSRQHPEALTILELFNKGLSRLRESGEYDRIIASYLDADPAFGNN